MRNKYVTKTGRALSPGRVTRAGNLVRKRSKSTRPLPIELQCHPKALTPTPVNPRCYSNVSWQGEGMRMANTLTRKQMAKHPELRKEGKYEIEGYGHTDNIHFAMAFRLAASVLGMGNLGVYES